jgi:RNA polymerase sigma-B factor
MTLALRQKRQTSAGTAAAFSLVWVLISMISLATHPRTPASFGVAPTMSARTEDLLSQRDRLPVDDPERATLRARAIEANLPMAGRLARRYGGRGETPDDLAQVAAMALIKAVDGFDPSRTTPFAGYAIPSILGALKRHFRDSGWAMRVPRSTQNMVLMVRGDTAELAHRTGHQPTLDEVAEHLQVRIEDVREAMVAAQAYRLDSLDSLRDAAEGPSATLERALGATDPGYAQLDNSMAIRGFVAAMPARDRRILSMRFHDEMTQADIANAIGVSQMHVSRLLKQALSQLRSRLTADDVASHS